MYSKPPVMDRPITGIGKTRWEVPYLEPDAERRIAARQRTAADRDCVTVDRSGVIRREKHDGCSNFFRLNRALHRDDSQEELARCGIFQLLSRQRRLHQARSADDKR